MMVNIQKKKLMEELSKQFPRMRNVGDISDVLIAGNELGALDAANGKKKWAFVQKGAKDNSFYSAYGKYKLLQKKKSERRAFVMYMRGGRISNDNDIRIALNREKKGLFAHLIASHVARDAAAAALSLQSTNLDEIRKRLEKGSIMEQMVTYGKVVSYLTIKKIYDKNYDYYWLGFRFIADKYWISNMGLKLLSQSR